MNTADFFLIFLQNAMSLLSHFGFLNYFGPQRFGLDDKEVNACDIGLAMLQGDMVGCFIENRQGRTHGRTQGTAESRPWDKGEARSSRPLDKGGAVPPLKCFLALRALLWSQNKGGPGDPGPSPGSATTRSFQNTHFPCCINGNFREPQMWGWERVLVRDLA